MNTYKNTDKYTILLDFIIENPIYTKYTSSILKDFIKENFNNIDSIDKFKSEYNRIILYFDKNYKNIKILNKERIKRKIFIALMMALNTNKYINPKIEFNNIKNVILEELYRYY